MAPWGDAAQSKVSVILNQKDHYIFKNELGLYDIMKRYAEFLGENQDFRYDFVTLMFYLGVSYLITDGKILIQNSDFVKFYSYNRTKSTYIRENHAKLIIKPDDKAFNDFVYIQNLASNYMAKASTNYYMKFVEREVEKIFNNPDEFTKIIS
jgi:hypothetical protein